MRRFLSLTLLALPVGYCWGQNPEPSPRDAGAEKKLCLCTFHVSGTSKRGNIGGFVGGIAGGAIASSTGSYYDSIRAEVQKVYETALAESGVFQQPGDGKLIAMENGKDVSLADAATKNKLKACVSAKTYWAARMGWNKRAAVATKWEVVGAGKCKFKVSTTASSDETHGMFPNGADPALKPVYLALAKDDVKQFLEALPKAMTKAGCAE